MLGVPAANENCAEASEAVFRETIVLECRSTTALIF